jgi:hypothetical protein
VFCGISLFSSFSIFAQPRLTSGHLDKNPLLKYLRKNKINYIIASEDLTLNHFIQTIPLSEKITEENFDDVLRQAELLRVNLLGITVITHVDNRNNLADMKFFDEDILLPKEVKYKSQPMNSVFEEVDLRTLCSNFSGILEKAAIGLVIPSEPMGVLTCDFTTEPIGPIQLLNLIKLMCNVNGFDIICWKEMLEIVRKDSMEYSKNKDLLLNVPFQTDLINTAGLIGEERLISSTTSPQYLYVKGDYDDNEIRFKTINGLLRPYILMDIRGKKYPRYLELVDSQIFWEEIEGKRVPFSTFTVNEKEVKFRVTKIEIPKSGDH